MMQSFPTNLDDTAIYLRKSREDSEAEERARREGRQEIETLSRHRRTLLDLAHKCNHNIRMIFEEVVSGEYISERPEMQRLLDAVDNGDVTAVWVMDLDRLGRGDMADQGTILRTFKDSQTLILTPDKVYDLTDEMDEEWTEFKTFFARRELKMITKRMQRGRVASVQEGKYIGTYAPFGYDVNNDLVLIQNDKAAIVREIFDMYVNRNMGCTKIAHHLNAMGIKSPRGAIWRGENVLPILKNPVYNGYVTWRKTTKKTSKVKRGRKRPESDWIVARGQHEPIIDDVTFQRAKRIRESRGNAPVQRDKEVSSPLSGLIVCAKCGERLVKRPYKKQAAHILCKNPTCNNKSTRLTIVEDRLIQSLKLWLHEYTLQESELKEELQVPSSKSHIQTEELLTNIEHEIARVNGQRDRLHDFLEQGIYDTQTYLERNQKLLEELTQLQNQQESVREEVRRIASEENLRSNIAPRIQHVLDRYEQTDSIPAKNRLLRSVIEYAVYNKEKWQKGPEFDLDIYHRFNTDNLEV